MSSILRKLAQTVDYINESHAPVDTDGGRTQSGVYEKKVAALYQAFTNPPVTVDDLPAYVDAFLNSGGVGIDDRELLLEKLLTLMASTKDTSFSHKVQEAVISLLYKDLPHPPSGYLRVPPTTAPAPPLDVKYAYRTSDGSHYNPLAPAMGMAGTPYARSVPSRHTLPKESLPDPDLIFDTLLKREKFVPHPGGMSALFFAFADLVIHSIFKTNPHDWSINDASSYLDLSVLYGHSDRDVNAIRRKDGTGRLWNDVFADYRITHMPPASCALLVLLSRNHNYVAEKILDINESGKYTRTFANNAARDAQDDEIFHRARLVNCGYFMHIILGDYVGAILGLVRDGSDWRLDPMMTMRSRNHDFVPVGEGNVVSTEFNLLYRWHATLSDEDTKWTESLFQKMFSGKDPKDIKIDDFKEAAHKHLVLNIENVREWTFDGLKRGADGRFSDDDLARIIQNSTEYRAGAFKARGIPEALRFIEVMGIRQARTWGVCSLNEFRRFMGLKPYADFKQWNPDPKIYNAAQALYRDIENLELHVGLQAEETKEPGEGAGLCPGYTISRAILADAVCLTRGDRFFTVDYTPQNLTSWGFQDCAYDKQDGSFGGLLTKLLLRTLPNHYSRGNAYAHFPFMVPTFLEEHWKVHKPELVGKYTWTRPRQQPTIVPVGDYEIVTKVFADNSAFLSAYETRTLNAVKATLEKSVRRTLTLRGKRVSQAPGGSTTDKRLTQGRDEINTQILALPLSTYFSSKTKELIKAKGFTSADGSTAYVDIVRDVINLLPVHFVSQRIAGLPLKSDSTPKGVWYEQDMYDWFTDIAEYVYLNFQPEHDWRLRESTQLHGEEIIGYIKSHIDSIKNKFSLPDVRNHIAIGHNGHDFLTRIVDSLRNTDTSNRETAARIFAAVVPTAAIYASALSQIVSFFLQPSNASAAEALVSLPKSKDTATATTEVLGYIREALRLNPAIPGFYRTAARDVVLGPKTIQAYEVVYGSLYSANRDPQVFGPNPEVPVFNRQGKGAVLGLPNTGLTTEEFLAATVPAVLSEIMSLKGVKKAANKSGRFNEFQENWHGYPRKQYINAKGAVSSFPDSLILQYQVA
ncbi:heme peroxidase [Coprinopsis cinerea AmutBmut pab1-1]|nr:heme peroxidase [Coprinopsis cinerea AmutBmut pab1-1]